MRNFLQALRRQYLNDPLGYLAMAGGVVILVIIWVAS